MVRNIQKYKYTSAEYNELFEIGTVKMEQTLKTVKSAKTRTEE